MKKYKRPDLVTVVGVDGIHLLVTPLGENINGLVWTRVTDEIDGLPYVVCKIQCNIAESISLYKDEPPLVHELKRKIEEYRSEEYKSKLSSEKLLLHEVERKMNAYLEESKRYKSLFKEYYERVLQLRSKWWYRIFKNW